MFLLKLESRKGESSFIKKKCFWLKWFHLVTSNLSCFSFPSQVQFVFHSLTVKSWLSFQLDVTLGFLIWWGSGKTSKRSVCEGVEFGGMRQTAIRIHKFWTKNVSHSSACKPLRCALDVPTLPSLAYSQSTLKPWFQCTALQILLPTAPCKSPTKTNTEFL